MKFRFSLSKILRHAHKLTCLQVPRGRGGKDRRAEYSGLKTMFFHVHADISTMGFGFDIAAGKQGNVIFTSVLPDLQSCPPSGICKQARLPVRILRNKLSKKVSLNLAENFSTNTISKQIISIHLQILVKVTSLKN